MPQRGTLMAGTRELWNLSSYQALCVEGLLHTTARLGVYKPAYLSGLATTSQTAQHKAHGLDIPLGTMGELYGTPDLTTTCLTGQHRVTRESSPHKQQDQLSTNVP